MNSVAVNQGALTIKTSSGRSSRGLVVSALIVFLPLTLAGILLPSFRLVSLATVSLGIMSVPIFQAWSSEHFDWFSPWNWLFYFAFFGVFLRSIYITFDIPDEIAIRAVFLGPESKEFLVWPGVVVLLGLFCTTLGYLVGPKTSRRISLQICQSDQWYNHRTWIAFSALLVIAWIGFYFFITNTSQFLDLENLSALRGLDNDLSQYGAYGYFRWMINLSDLVCLLVVAKMVSARRIRLPELTVFVLSLGTSLFYYYYVQARSGIIVIILNSLVITYYLYGKKVPIKKILVAAPVAVFVFRWMTILRPGSGYTRSDWFDLNPIRAFEPMIMNTNGIDVSKTGHIMEAVGRQLDFEWGWTLLNVFFIWIPRQIWPEKPTNVDTVIGMTVFGARTYGAGAVPPGLIAEMYWNFWIPGVIVGCFLLGYLLRYVFTQFKAYSKNRNVVIWYVVVFMQMGVAFMGSGFSSALTSFLMTSLPLLIILRLITKPETSQTNNPEVV